MKIRLIWLFLLFIPFLAQAQAPLRQDIPIGMYNAYLPEDGNLAQSIPDMQEVWEGMPNDWPGGHFPFEACNLVQHYWPNPMPASGTREDRYVAWTKHFLSEVYRQGNDNGEVRLRAIVGELFVHYDVLGDAWLTNFIHSLCAWEESGPQNGVIAGWYLTEEPMGSGKNYDIAKYERMAEIIDETERAGGFRRHDRYMDTGVDSKFITPDKFARFTRPADVVMVSASSYIWLTGRTQPVYSPQWVAFPYILNRVRQMVVPDRKAHGLPEPKIHIVLQGAELRNHRPTDDRAYGQPTNWEMRQQIRKILTPDTKYTGKLIEPADGFWIFWWTGLTFDNDNRVDDWVHGRRLAEAIEVEVAELTGHSADVQSPYTPQHTRFLFEPDTPFNPNESNIPYELARSGEVVVEVRRPNGILVEQFDMGVQSAGRLERFGGPMWRPGSRYPDGRYTFRLFLDDERMDSVTADVQTRPALSSPSHKTGFWYQQREVEVVWQAPSAVEGIVGYSTIWDESPSSYPPRTAQFDPEVTALTSDPLPDGDAHYFHIRHVDAMGNWSDPAALGPFWIDASPPEFVSDITSPSHTPGEWSTRNTVQLNWQTATDPHSGLHGYAVIWDRSPAREADLILNVGSGITELESPTLLDGEWFAHIRAVDLVGNWSPTMHLGPFRIDTTPPEPPTNLLSTSHDPGRWSNQSVIWVGWEPAREQTSGISAYHLWWDQSPEGSEPAEVESTSDTQALSPQLADGEHWFHVQSVDHAGQLAAPVHLGPFLIDTIPPTPATFMLNHAASGSPVETQQWLTANEWVLVWIPGEDSLSGIDVHQLRLELFDDEPKPGRSPTLIQEYLLESAEIPVALADGFWLVHLVAQDGAGNRETSTQAVKIDARPPVVRITDSTHPSPTAWYPIAQVQMEWTASDETSGVDAFRWAVDSDPETTPTSEPTSAERAMFETVPGIHYFHLLAVDRAGNQVVTHQQVQIDDQLPIAPLITSGTHAAGEWSAETEFAAEWDTPVPLSGIAGYAISLDKVAGTEPFPTVNAIAPSHAHVLSEGVWYLHVRSQSNSGLWSPTTHYEVRVDTTPPTLQLASPTHDSQSWNSERTVQFTWSTEDSGSGVQDGLWAWDQSPDAQPTQVVDGTTIEMDLTAAQDGVHFFHLQTRDRTGNRSAVAHYRVQIDASAPGMPTLASITHPRGRWTNRSHVLFQWSQPTSLSGIRGYSLSLTTNSHSLPDETVDTAEQQFDVPGSADGIHYFHVRAQSQTGLWGAPDHYEIRIDTQAPDLQITWPESDRWYSEPIRRYEGTVEDTLAGIDWSTLEYRYGDHPWISFHADEPPQDTWLDADQIPDTDDTPGTPLQVQVADLAGNLTVSPPVLIKVDTQRPIVRLSSPTHPRTEMLSPENQPTFTWQVESNHAQVTRFLWGVDRESGGIPLQPLAADTRQLVLDPLGDGRWHFYIAAQNEAGQTSEPAHWTLDIDTTPPVGTVTWQAPMQESTGVMQHSPHRVGAGRMHVHVTVSEPIRETPPPFWYQIEGYDAVLLTLEAGEADGWQTTLDVLPSETPDGVLRFGWAAVDQAGNIADSVVGDAFRIDTLLTPSAVNDQLVGAQDGATLHVPVGALTRPLRLAILPATSSKGSPPGRILAGYRVQAFAEEIRPLGHLDFHAPCTLRSPIPDTSRQRVYLFDGVQYQPVSSWVRGNALETEIRQTGDYFVVTSSSTIRQAIQAGWAAPNPFTPNGSGDASDRTVFHVQTREPSVNYQVTVFDLGGRRVRELQPREHIWDGRDDSGQLLQGGVYLFQIRSDEELLSGSVVLIR